jgi:sugar lactone lactonase YvrE
MPPGAAAQAEPLVSGLVIGESPRWHEDRLWLSNWGAAEIVAVDAEGRRETMVAVPTSLPFCFDWTPDGTLLIVSGPEAKLLRREPDGRLLEHADLAAITAHPWNEIVVDGRGNAYLNSIGFDMMGGGEPGPGLIAVLTPDGELRQVAGDLAFPNGMVVTPDNRTLIVSESYAQRLTAFDVEPDGSLSNRRVWAQLDAYPDGICLDAEGAVWAGAMSACVRVREGGEILQILPLDRSCFACMLGGQNGRTLFAVAAEWNGPENMTAGRTGMVFTVSAPAPRAGWPG